MLKKNNYKFNSEKIYIIKAWAVLSIVTAHINVFKENTVYLNKIISAIFDCMGIIGVCVFFIISGFLFYGNQRSVKEFYKRKIKSIIIPWIVTGSAVYFYVYLRKGGISIMSYINFIIGNGSYLYFLTVLSVIYFIFFYIKKDIQIYTLLIISIISNVLTVHEVIKVNPYLNIINWCIYFGIGILLAKNDLFNKVTYICNKIIPFTSLIFIALILINIINQNVLTYWSYMSFIIIIIGILLIFGIDIKNNKIKKLLENIGKKSFSIYLLHMPVAGIIVNIFNRYDLNYLSIFRPIIVIYIVIIFIDLYLNITEKFKFDYTILIGYRQ